MALLLLTLRTGRRNQIRVQLADAGWPVLGDSKYGVGDGHPLHLHAFKLSFPHPETGKVMSFEVPPERGAFALFRREIGIAAQDGGRAGTPRQD